MQRLVLVLVLLTACNTGPGAVDDAGGGVSDAAGDVVAVDGDRCAGVTCEALSGACTVGVCNAATGACEARPRPDGTPCDDGVFCTVREACTAGVCGGGVQARCDDGNPCTNDLCNEGPGTCVNAPLADGAPCDDGAFCTTGESCSAGVCGGGVPRSCDDGNPCTADACGEAADACDHAPLPDGTSCDDGFACTVGETCTAAACGGGAPPDCRDDNPCTEDVCTEGVGCEHPESPDGAPCDDGSACTQNDQCTPGASCFGDFVDCSAMNTPCHVFVCEEPSGACVDRPLSGIACDDGNPCTSSDVCDAGTCAGAAVADGTPCRDGNACTMDSACSAGACATTPIGNGCDIYSLRVGGYIDVSQSPTARRLETLSADNADTVNENVTLPFAFPFFDTTATVIGVTSDGFINVGPGAYVGPRPFPAGFPSIVTPNGAVYAFWDDLTSGTTGDVFVDVRGSSPNRFVVVQWKDYQRRTTPVDSDRLHFEAILYEDGGIQLLYGPSTHTRSDLPGAMWGTYALAGVENAAGTLGTSVNGFGGAFYPGRIITLEPSSSDNYSTELRAHDTAEWIDVRTVGARVGGDPGTATNCDDCTTPVPLPFVFSFGGVDYGPGQPSPDVHVSSNGNVQFGATPSASSANHALPYSPAPSAMIACFWDDLLTTDAIAPGADIYTAVVGRAPYRKFVVQYVDVAFAPADGSDLNFEIVLSETTNRVDCVYGPSTGANTIADREAGASATAGLNYVDGMGVGFSSDQAALPQGRALHFYPTWDHGTNQHYYAGSAMYESYQFPDVSRTPGVAGFTPDDDGFTEVPLGFAFEYYGTSYQSVFMSDNGFLTFGAGSGSNAPVALPNASAPRAMIAPFWADLATDVNPGAIYYATTGTAPTRVFTAQFQSTNHRGATPASGIDATFAVRLHEGTNAITFDYGALVPVSQPLASGDMTSVGVQNETGASGISVGFSQPGTLATGSHFEITPRISSR